MTGTTEGGRPDNGLKVDFVQRFNQICVSEPLGASSCNMVWIICAASILISGCNGGSEKVCKKAISDSLLNPESAKFFDYKVLSDAEFRERASAWALESAKSHNMSQVETAEIWQARKGVYEELLAESKAEGKDRATVRYQAQGKLGNTITEVALCIGNDESCYCDEPQYPIR